MGRLCAVLGIVALADVVGACADLSGLNEYADQACPEPCTDGPASSRPRDGATDPRGDGTVSPAPPRHPDAGGELPEVDASAEAAGDPDAPEIQETEDDAPSDTSIGEGHEAGAGESGSDESGAGEAGSGESGPREGGGADATVAGTVCANKVCTNLCVPYYVPCCRSDQQCGCALFFPPGVCE